LEWVAGAAADGAWAADHESAVAKPRRMMRDDMRKSLLFAVALIGGLIVLLAVVIFVLARSGVLEGLSHL
jgi:hypothetical protein